MTRRAADRIHRRDFWLKHFDDYRIIEMKELATALRLLGDETRLRSLRLLRREELNAGELARVLDLGPPALSRQLSLLRDAGLISERRAGRYAYFRAVTESAPGDGLLALVAGRLDDAEDLHGDLARLEDVLRTRRERRMSAGGRRAFVPGRSWAAWARVVGLLVPPGLRVADLGCGDGALALEIASTAARRRLREPARPRRRRVRRTRRSGSATSSGCRCPTPRWTSRSCRSRCTSRRPRLRLRAKRSASWCPAGACS
jgi:DNA-binding transcriptional ArsR family regulator